MHILKRVGWYDYRVHSFSEFEMKKQIEFLRKKDINEHYCTACNAVVEQPDKTDGIFLCPFCRSATIY